MPHPKLSPSAFPKSTYLCLSRHHHTVSLPSLPHPFDGGLCLRLWIAVTLSGIFLHSLPGFSDLSMSATPANSRPSLYLCHLAVFTWPHPSTGYTLNLQHFLPHLHLLMVTLRLCRGEDRSNEREPPPVSSAPLPAHLPLLPNTWPSPALPPSLHSSASPARGHRSRNSPSSLLSCQSFGLFL